MTHHHHGADAAHDHAHPHGEDDATLVELLDLDGEVLRSYWTDAIGWVCEQATRGGRVADRVLDLGDIPERDGQMRHIHYDWLDAGEQTQATVRQLSDQLRRFLDDQAWLEAKLPDAGAVGPEQGVYGFQKPGWPRGNALPRNASIAAFPGWRDPQGFTHLDWVKEHWRT